jgi:arylsulfatase
MNKPNILLITTDQQRFDTLACAGNPDIYTPHLDWLVHEGVLFERAYADSPSCIPSRASIMTGRPGYSTGLTTMSGDIKPMLDNPTLPGLLTQAGYQTRAQGKMHFMPMRAHYGFEEMELPIDFIRERDHYGAKGTLKAHGLGENEYIPGIDSVDDDQTFTHWTVRRSIDFLETRDDTRPFFMWTSFGKPHPPFTPTSNFWQLYANKEVLEPVYGDWSQSHDDIEPGFIGPTYALNNTWDASASQRTDTKRAYYACVTQIDYQLGILFARMREMELLENTWIIFTTDHGDMMGDHHMFGKGVFLEGSAHLPMIIRAPSSPWDANKPMAGEKVSTLVTLADIMPTILSIAGVDIPESVDGRNMLDFVTEPDDDRIFYGNSGENHFSIIKKNMKYMYARRGAGELLFDIIADPHEQHDLSKSKKHQTVKDELKQLLLDELKEYQSVSVADGKMPQVAAEKPQDPNKGIRWPGFHSTKHQSDLLH